MAVVMARNKLYAGHAERTYLSGFCQVVEAETLIRQVDASPRSYPPFRRPAPYL
jgi:hypothetical protein